MANNLLIVKLDGIGDYVLVHNYIDSLLYTGKFVGWHITLLCNDIWISLASTLLPKVRCIPLDIRQYERNAWYRFSLEQKLNAIEFDVIIHPTYSRCFWVDSLINRIKSDKKITFAGDTSNITMKDKLQSNKYYHELIEAGSGRLFEFERNRIFFWCITGESSKLLKPVISLNEDECLQLPFSDYAVMIIGANDAKRKWHPEFYTELAQSIRNEYGIKFVLCGGADDFNNSIAIERSLEHDCINLVGATSLTDMLSILLNSSIVIGNDTGLSHMAMALDKPVVVISNGNHLYRFFPYQGLSDKYRCVFPFDLQSMDESALDAYYSGSDIDINKVAVEQVYSEVQNLLIHHPLLRRTESFNPDRIYHAYSSVTEMFYRHNGKMFLFIERIKSQYERVMVYGYSTMGRTLASLLDGVFFGYIDLSAGILSGIADCGVEICQPEQVVEKKFDVIVISLLGREKDIEELLIDRIGIHESKVLRVEL